MLAERTLTDEEKERVQALGGWEQLLETLRTELLARFVLRFNYAIGVEEQIVAGGELHFALRVSVSG